MTKGKKILVTGASGLVGGAVCQQLVLLGYDVLGVDIKPGTVGERNIIQCDLTRPHRLHEVVANTTISGIVHCGALSGPMLAWNDPAAMFHINIEGTFNLLELARINGCDRFVYCSSTTAYGDTSSFPIVCEDTVLRPSNLYAASKASCEHLVSAYKKQYGVKGVSLRLSWVYGPGRSTESAMRTMIANAINEVETDLPYGSDFYREHIYVEDAARAVVCALRSTEPLRDTYNVTGGTYVTLSQVSDIIKKIVRGANISLSSGPDPVDDKQAQCDIGAAKKDLDYCPSVSLEDGIRKYVDWVRRHD